MNEEGGQLLFLSKFEWNACARGDVGAAGGRQLQNDGDVDADGGEDNVGEVCEGGESGGRKRFRKENERK